ncbi:MAG: putative metal-binding motif-containing protein [Archangiaceae bacterium]|nr:putative metal-binding motif-containing protein [Archangiaceae bacterium]
MLRSTVRLISFAAFAGVVACGKPEKLMPADSGPVLPNDLCLDNDGDGFKGTGRCGGVEDFDCNDADPLVHPQASEVCNAVDDDCDGEVDEGLPVASWYADHDGDGVGGSTSSGMGCASPPSGSVTTTGDCNDADPKVRPGVAETCNDVDDDCDGTKDNGLPFQDFYADLDGDGFGDATGAPQASCLTMVMGKVPNKSDCADRDPTVKPGATEICNRRDDNCDGQVDNGITYLAYYPDTDGDGFGAAGSSAEMSCGPVAGKVTNSTDCDDANPTVKPGAPEMCNGVDDNCAGGADEGLTFQGYYPDVDGDGVGAVVAPVSSCLPLPGKVTTTGDCNDTNAAVKPGATEVCNGVDDDCAGGVDNGLTFRSYYTDSDQDGFGTGSATMACAPIAGKATVAGDCNDNNAAVKPGAAEVCNGVDDDCAGGIDNGLTFQGYYPDGDGDGFGNKQAPAQSACAPVTNKVANNLDCDDGLFAVKPGATELCNTRDDDCDGQTDEGLTFTSYYPDLDSDGFGSSASLAQSACAPVTGKVANNTDCNDGLATVHPGATETCNGVDDNCDTQVDNGTMNVAYYVDNDGDGYGAGTSSVMSCAPVAGRAPNNTDCNDGLSSVHPNATEVCNGVDDNCVSGVDDGLTFLSYWPDADLDGFGNGAMASQSSCAPVTGKVTNSSDCNDGSAAVKPGATETCNQVDDNCAGGIDEGLPRQSYWADGDGDGFGAGSAVMACGAFGGRVPNNTDCNDANPAVRPTAIELCNGIDDNCAGGADEGDPGGGAACSTGQSGVCGPGTNHCVSGTVSCQRNVAPVAERCNNLDDDCNGQTDETFADKGNTCSAGQGVCLKTGTRVCRTDGSATQCSVDAGAPTVPACDDLDNDCDGIVDEPYFSSTFNVSTPVPWADLEVAPYYFTAGSCAGGVNGSGTDQLQGGALLMGAGADGLYFQKLDTSGAPTGLPVTVVSSFRYVDVAIAQAGDGFIVAGIYDGEPDGVGDEIDLYYLDSSGAWRADRWSMFDTGKALDSLRLVRGNGKRVTLIWREAGVGLRYYRVEPTYSGSTWSVTQVGGAALTTATAPNTLVANTATLSGVGADSAIADWAATQTCASTATLQQVGVAYRVSAPILRHFTVNEDGTGKSADLIVRDVSPVAPSNIMGRVVLSPDVAFFRDASLNQWFITYVMQNPDLASNPMVPKADLEVWLSNHPGYNWAWLQFATQNGVNSITRPRGSVTATRLWVTGQRYVADASGFRQQIMTRQFDYAGARDPNSSSVELSPATGACSGDPPCRGGNKDGVTNWAPFGRVYYAASGATPTGVFSSTLTCQ